MSDNKGKDGEHGALALLAIAAIDDNSLEVMRFSETNVPDMGQDIFATASNQWVQKFGEITIPNYEPPEKFKNKDDDFKRRLRFDVKTSESIDKTKIQKAAADIKKHANTDTHIILGGTLKPAAEKELERVRKDYPSKEILHVSDSGIKDFSEKLNIPVERLFPHIKFLLDEPQGEGPQKKKDDEGDGE